MDHKEFERVFEDQVDICRSMLVKKANEYAFDDERLHNFIIAGGLQGQTPVQALGGMMAKHTVSIYDMIDSDSDGLQDFAKWDEKITDHINYLILLRACLIQAQRNEALQASDPTLFDH